MLRRFPGGFVFVNTSDYARFGPKILDNDPEFNRMAEVRGHDFDSGIDLGAFISSLGATGIQASKLARAIEIAKHMVAAKATVFLTCTSNMGSSGVRDIIRYLVQHRHVHALCMSAGAVEEDVIKTLQPFILGDFSSPGKTLREKGFGRIGNILVPYDRYLCFEQFMQPFLERVYEESKERGSPFSVSEFIYELGKLANNPSSMLYWASRNNIPVFCPALTDGAIGDLLTFARMRHSDFCIDIVGDSLRIFQFVKDQEKTGAIILGGGPAKHFVLNANIFRDGLDYAVYISTAVEYDASDSGGNPEEAISWAKIRTNGEHVKVNCEASIAFPLLVAAVFAHPAQNGASPNGDGRGRSGQA
jgi:deoxyhypusine synthase